MRVSVSLMKSSHSAMYSTGLLVVCLTVVLAHDPEGFEKCRRLMHPPTLECCKRTNMLLFAKDDDMKECFQRPPSCDHATCIASKKGFASSDGTIDKEALVAALEKDLKDEPETLDAIKTKCINGDITRYGPPEFCDQMKLLNCIKSQYINNCSDWDEGGHCKGIKDLVTECKSKAQE